MEKEFYGVGISPLCAIGRLHFFGRRRDGEALSGPRLTHSTDSICAELERLDIALEKVLGICASRDMDDSMAEAVSERAQEIALRARENIFGGKAAESAAEDAARELALLECGGSDPMLSFGSAAALRAGDELLSSLGSIVTGSAMRPMILVAKGITAKELAAIDRELLLGILLPTSSPFSEEAILAREMSIPVITSCRELSDEGGSMLEGKDAIIDGEKGVLTICPEGETVALYGKRIASLALGKRTAFLFSHCYARITDTRGANLLPRGIRGSDILLLPGAFSDINGISELLSVAEGMGEIRLILPKSKKHRALCFEVLKPLSGRGKRDVFLIDPFVSSPTDIEKLSEQVNEIPTSENIKLCASINNLSALLLCREIASRCDLLFFDADPLLRLMTAEDEPKAGKPSPHVIEAVLRGAEMVASSARSRGIPFSVSLSPLMKKEETERLRELGADSFSVPLSYFGKWGG